jgi:hypothetical protein
MVDLVPTITLTNLEMTQKLKNLVSDVRRKYLRDLAQVNIVMKRQMELLTNVTLLGTGGTTQAVEIYFLILMEVLELMITFINSVMTQKLKSLA